MLKEDINMCVGIRGRLWGLPRLIAKIDPLNAIGGERAIKRELFENIPEKFLQGFAVEPALNYYCRLKSLPVKHVHLKKLKIIIKEQKWGILNGFISRVKMVWQVIKIRMTIKNELI